MKKYVDFRLSAAVLTLPLLSGSTCSGQEASAAASPSVCICEQAGICCAATGDAFFDKLHGLVKAAMTKKTHPQPLGFDFQLVEAEPNDGTHPQPLVFDFQHLKNCSCGTLIALCGHVCDGDGCYETDDSPASPGAACELATGAKGDVSFRIETREVAPPMPTMRSGKSQAADDSAQAQLQLGKPTEWPASTAGDRESYSSETLEVVRLQCELDAARQQLDAQRSHHEQLTELLGKLHEAESKAASLSVQQEMLGSFTEKLIDSFEEKAELAVKLGALQADNDAMQRLHDAALETARLKAELAAAKEWISQRVASEQAAPQIVAMPMPPMFAPQMQPLVMPSPVYDQPFVGFAGPRGATEYQPTFPVATGTRVPTGIPIPFAFGSYVPRESSVASCGDAACGSQTCSMDACGKCPCASTATASSCDAQTCPGESCAGKACGSIGDMAVCGAGSCPAGVASASAERAAQDAAVCSASVCGMTACDGSNCGECGCEKPSADANFAERVDTPAPAASR